jgi:hypothetical protein
MSEWTFRLRNADDWLPQPCLPYGTINHGPVQVLDGKRFGVSGD